VADERLGQGVRDAEQRSGRKGPDFAGLGRRALEVESNSVLIATLALILFIGVLHPDFLAWGQLKEVVQNAAYVGIIAGGMAFLISMREIDLSVGSMFGLSLIISALFMQHGMNPWLGALLGILLGCGMGLFNAVLVQFIAIPAIVATLATLSMYRGPLPGPVGR
jgi:ribose transport system permease protein